MMKADESRKLMNYNALREVDSSRPLCVGHLSFAFELGFSWNPTHQVLLSADLIKPFRSAKAKLQT